MSTQCLDQEKVARAKQEHASALIKETQVLARRAESPEDRVALAELEAVIRRARDGWRDAPKAA